MNTVSYDILLDYCVTPRQREIIQSLVKTDNVEKTSEELDISIKTVNNAIGMARSLYSNLKDSGNLVNVDKRVASLRQKLREKDNEVKKLRREYSDLHKKSSDIIYLEKLIYGFNQRLPEIEIPNWVINPDSRTGILGVPTLFFSDFHWGETVAPEQVNYVNKFNTEIARNRLKNVVEITHKLLFDEFARPDYPGIVLPLGGDMVSGNIHDELRETNDAPILEIVIDLFENLVATINQFKSTFKQVYVPCVVGNHGRIDRRWKAKNRVRDNYEWILYKMLEKHYIDDPSVVIHVSDSVDLRYRVFGKTYLLNHGDDKRGGNGISGPLTAYKLSEYRKTKRSQAVNQNYDVEIFGHWHYLQFLGSQVVNGSLKGYDEYAMSGSFPFQDPMQALWIDHPKHGTTFQMKVVADSYQEKTDSEWLSISSISEVQ